MSAPDHILYDLVSKVDSKVDALIAKLDDKFSDLNPRIATLETRVSQLEADRDRETDLRVKAQDESRSNKRNTWYAIASAVVAFVTAAAQALIGG